MGVISVETRTIERIVPADPANPASFEQRIMEAGQVWYPNSAYKTAQAIFDFSREDLPLIIFANWRGFSGGQQDMYDEVLKQGSKIVDGLSSYKQPVFVYIVPNGELRGGAWVVLDPSINAEQMEMYADVEARAGVLEPEGVVEIRMRRDKILRLMERLDSTYASLKKDSTDASKTAEERATASEQLTLREKHLQPSYRQIALLYADLHECVAFLNLCSFISEIFSVEQVAWKPRVALNQWFGRMLDATSIGLFVPVSPVHLHLHRWNVQVLD
jgi:acetyl-CoA carboxylase/biotin carboxylase 1